MLPFFVSFPHCRVRLRIVGRSLPGGNSLSPHSSSLHCEKTNFKTVSFKELPFKRVSPKGIAKVDKISVFPNFFGKIQKFRVAESKGMIICLSLFRKPSFLDSLFLLEQFQY